MKSRTLRRGAYILLSRIFVLVVLVFNSNIGFSEDLAQTLYNNNSQYIVQIQVIELVSSKKSSIGSGFLISGDGLIATNYHVISSYIHQPDKYRVEYTNEDNENGDLKVEDIDVINDLAILKSAISSEVYLELSQKLPENGEPIYSMGNPLDLGSAVVPGTYNGYISSSYYHRIHFTGSINPGMSGGPVFNQLNEVIGVNVATSGNQISFLIPVDKLKKLLNEYLARNEDPIDFNKRIREQLIDNQKKLMKSIFSIDWGREKLGDAEVLSKLSEFVTCWGSKKEQKKKERFSVVSIDCQMKEDIYIDRSFNTGKIGYQYKWLKSISLNPFQFYALIEGFYSKVYSVNQADKDDVSSYKCHEDFINNPDQRAVYCAREYADYPGLYDVVFVSSTVHKNNKALLSYFSLSGIEKQSAMAFAKRFLGYTKWN